MINSVSIEVYHSIKNSGILSDKRMKVYDIFYENPQGLTGSEVSEIYKSKYPSSKHSETIRNRITELRDMGVLDEIAIVTCQYTNRSVTKFRLNHKMPTSLEKKETLNEKLDKILQNIVELGHSMQEGEQKNKLRLIHREIKNLKK